MMSNRRWYTLGRRCDCGTEINDGSKTGKCLPCFNSFMATDPAIRAKKSEGLKRYAANPANHAAMRARGQRAAAKRLSNPEHAAWASEFMRTKVQPLSCTPEELARTYRHEAGLKTSEMRIAWCPPEYREDYRYLINHGTKKAEAKPMILQMIAAKRKRERAALSPFERQMADLEAKVRNGTQDIGVHDARKLA